MKKCYLLAAGFLMLLGSCSQDELVDVNPDSLGDQIEFSVVTNGATRANAIYHSNNLPTGFNVSAKSDGKSYILKDHYSFTDGKWINDNGTRYWPEDEDQTIDFYAYVNGEVDWNPATSPYAKFKTFTVADGEEVTSDFIKNLETSSSKGVANQVDLLYAVKLGQTKTEDAVTLNFRHALSQIVFNAKNVSKNLFVKVAGVKVVNVKGTGSSFEFPDANTDNNIKGADGEIAGPDYPSGANGWGTWTLSGDATQAYGVDLAAAVPVPYGETTPVALTTENDKDAMMLLPQTTTAWAEGNDFYGADAGSYILVDCYAYNIADGQGGEGNVEAAEGEDGKENIKETLIWGTDNGDGTYSTRWLAIPASFNWEQGKKYIYTIVFGKDGGGFIPGEDPDPVFVPVTFDVTVDDFVTVDKDIVIEQEEAEEEPEP